MAENQVKRMNRKLDRLPIPMPVRRVIHVLSVTFLDTLRSDLLKQASAMAYVTLLSLIPSLVAIFCVFSLFTPLFMGQRNLVDEIKNWVLSHLASGSGENVVQFLDQTLEKLDLKTIGWSSFISVLVTLVMLLRQIEIALNKIWQINKSRNVFVRFIYFWTFLTLSMLAIGALVGLSVPNQISQMFDPKSVAESPSLYGKMFNWAVSLGGSTLFFFLLYKVIPNCKVYSKPAAIGAIISAFLINEGGYLYGLFVRDSANYKTIYGAMAQLPIFLMWLYFCWSIILLGALISWRIQEGFPKLDDHDALDNPQHPRDYYRNTQIKNLLPWLALIAVSKRFSEGDHRGLSSQEFAHHFDIPISWASKAFEFLIEIGCIHASSSSEKSTKKKSQLSAGFQVADPCYPSVSPVGLDMSKISHLLTQDFKDWLYSMEEKIPPIIPEAILHVLNNADQSSSSAAPALEMLAQKLPHVA